MGERGKEGEGRTSEEAGTDKRHSLDQPRGLESPPCPYEPLCEEASRSKPAASWAQGPLSISDQRSGEDRGRQGNLDGDTLPSSEVC